MHGATSSENVRVFAEAAGAAGRALDGDLAQAGVDEHERWYGSTVATRRSAVDHIDVVDRRIETG